VVYLAATAVLGLLLTINLSHPFFPVDHLKYLTLHAHLGFAGWITLVVMGVSYKLIPMFTLAHDYSLKYEKPALWLINAGMLLFTLTAHEGKGIFFSAGLAFISASVLMFLLQIRRIFRHRVRRNVDTGIKFSMYAYLMMGLTLVLGVFTAIADAENIPNLTLAYGVMIIFGYISLLISGQMYKIVPFLVWYDKYSSKAGREPVPLLKEMVKETYAEAQLMMLLIASFGAVFALVFRSETGALAAFSLLFAGSLLFLYNMIYIFKR
jgi:cbb3-type cytochrome oxidase subunit 1